MTRLQFLAFNTLHYPMPFESLTMPIPSPEIEAEVTRQLGHLRTELTATFEAETATAKQQYQRDFDALKTRFQWWNAAVGVLLVAVAVFWVTDRIRVISASQAAQQAELITQGNNQWREHFALLQGVEIQQITDALDNNSAERLRRVESRLAHEIANSYGSLATLLFAVSEAQYMEDGSNYIGSVALIFDAAPQFQQVLSEADSDHYNLAVRSYERLIDQFFDRSDYDTMHALLADLDPDVRAQILAHEDSHFGIAWTVAISLVHELIQNGVIPAERRQILEEILALRLPDATRPGQVQNFLRGLEIASRQGWSVQVLQDQFGQGGRAEEFAMRAVDQFFCSAEALDAAPDQLASAPGRIHAIRLAFAALGEPRVGRDC